MSVIFVVQVYMIMIQLDNYEIHNEFMIDRLDISEEISPTPILLILY